MRGAVGRRGTLRVHLGAAPGVGTTVAMLEEGRRRRARGTDVVVGWVEDHGRPYTRQAVGDLPVVPGRTVRHRGPDVTELDTDAVLARAPEVALVDELAHTNPAGSPRPRRYQDVQVLLDAGIDVVTTLDVQQLESLRDVVAAITGVRQDETVPDEVVRSAAAVELVDRSPEALRGRLAYGHVFPAERVDAAQGHFREGTLTALRELALLWLADRVDEGLGRYRAEHGIAQTWPARERTVVALSGGPEGELLLRRGARIAGAAAGRSMVAVHVLRTDGGLGARPAELERQRQLTQELGGTLHLLVGDDVPATVLSFARRVNGTQIVVGASGHGRWVSLLRPSTVSAVIRGSGDVDVHVVTHPAHRTARSPLARLRRLAAAVRRARPATRSWLSWAAALLTPPVLAAAMWPGRSALDLTTQMLVFLLGVLAVGLTSTVAAATVSALLAGLLVNVLFTPPIGSLTIALPRNAFALAVFVVTAVVVASTVSRSARRARAAAGGRAEAQLLATTAVDVAEAADPLRAVLDRVRAGFGMTGAALVAAPGDPRPPGEVAGGADAAVLAGSGRVPDGLAAPDVVAATGTGHRLVAWGRPLPAEEHRLLETLATQAVVAADRVRDRRDAAEASRLKASDSVRTAVLAALSHDLRTPLATIKASVSGLADRSVHWLPADRDELLDTAAEAVDQLDDLVRNLLDQSRLDTGVLAPVLAPVSVDEVVHRALLGLAHHGPPGAPAVDVAIPDDLPLVTTDAGLLERVLANVVANAVRHSPPHVPVRIRAALVGTGGGRSVVLRVADRGPGVPEHDRGRMFRPFQRLGDVPAGSGIGLGLAVARGLAEAVGVTIDAEGTPGGGLTMVLTVPVDAAPAGPGGPAEAAR
ncbi:sensor histidine kinase [Nakamurella endophytica]|uniref:sensor histidine kinase n=1 Tax=Nakamurella endophytica TaxID=1748367 RepID=UPI001E60765F|nr:ATP-binding protein [Nakamurella endophytica]